MNVPLLSVDGLTVTFRKPDGSDVEVVRDASFEMEPGKIMGLVGESGSGKTMIGLSLLDLLPTGGRRSANAMRLGERDLLTLSDREQRNLRGRDIAMIFQDPMSSFNPVRTIGAMLREVLARHSDISGSEADRRIIAMLDDVGIPSPDRRINAYPHELSGGLRQRAMIAMAMLNDPVLLIADEPTTALDTTIQSQILRLLRERLDGRGILLVTHDLGVAAETCDSIAVMRHGQIVETGPTRKILDAPAQDYTKQLIAAVPSLHRPYQVTSRPAQKSQPLLETRGLRVTFGTDRGRIYAVNGVDLAVGPGETVGLVGESGSGKSTLVSALMGIHEPDGGKVLFAGQDVAGMNRAQRSDMRRRLQMVFQDPYSSLNPRWLISRLIAEPMKAQKLGSRVEIAQKSAELLELVGLPRDAHTRTARQFSGGQRQRIAIARALSTDPDLLIADEPVSALDVSMQAQIVTLLKNIQRQRGVGYLVIAHDMALMHHIADRIVVMYLGEIVEEAPAHQLTSRPAHPYTAALISAAPDTHPSAHAKPRIVLTGEQPSPMQLPSGCPFRTRCPIAQPKCATDKPPLKAREARTVACHYPWQLNAQA